MNRHFNIHNKFHWSLRACVWLIVSLLVVACGGRDSGIDTGGNSEGTTTVETPQGTDGAGTSGQQPINTGGAIGQGQSSAGSASPQPEAQHLQTLEEQPVNGLFTLKGENAVSVYDEQQFDIFTQPLNGTVSVANQSRAFTYEPAVDFSGTDSFLFSISSGLSARITIDVINVNDAPTIFAQIQRVIEQDVAYTAALIGSDPDNDSLHYRSMNLPDWLSLDSSTGALSGVPTAGDVGVYENIGFSVTDPDGLVGEVSGIQIEVIKNNDAPSINVDRFPRDLDAGELISVPLFPDDPNGDAVNVTFEPNEYLSVSVSDGVVEVIALEVSAVTEVALTLLVTDDRGGIARSTVPFTVYPINASGRGRTIVGRSASGAGIHLVVLGDGYRSEQQGLFRQHANKLIAKMQGDVGIDTHFSAWNVHMVETPSVDSGIDDDVNQDIRNTVFGTGYFCQGVRRLICGDRSMIYGVAIDEYPNFDQILVLVNDSRYGGSGGNIAISSTESIEIALHEMGHSIAGLADEYTDQFIPDSIIPAFVEGRYANVSTSNDPSEVPWEHWFNSANAVSGSAAGVGIFEGAYYRDTGFFRPTVDSLMRSYDGTLGPVNAEQWALSVYSRSNPVLEISPVNRELLVAAGDVVDFSVLPLFDETIQSVQWQLDARDIPDSGNERPSVSLSFPSGRFDVALKVRDISGLIRKPEPHAGIFEWSWTVVAQ